jgi:serine-type D-Ala-D-Ala carboxypeptidase/endopeptidase
MNPRKSATCWLVTAVLACCAQTYADSVVDPAKVDALVRPLVEGGWVAGAAIGLINERGTQVVGYGRVSDASDSRPDAQTLFEIGSVSKVFTGLLLADMAERGLVKLDEPVEDLLGGSMSVPKGKRAITLVDLATHSSGLPRLPSNLDPRDPMNPYADYTVDQLAKFLAGYKLAREPGVRSEYSNLGMGLLGHALAHKAGVSYEELLRERICKPLAMYDTRIVLDEKRAARLAKGHDPDGGLQGPWDLPTLAGAGAIRSTVADMLKFLGANLEFGKSPLAAAISASKTVRFKSPGGGDDVGLAWQIRRIDGVVWHNGQTGGYHSIVAFWPAKRAGVVVLCNTASMHVDRTGFDLLELVGGGDPKPPSRPSAVVVAPEDIEPLVGSYKLAPTVSVTITRDADQLFVQLTGQPKIKFFPESKDRYFCRLVEASVSFDRDAEGKIERLVVHQNGQDLPAPRNP